MVLDEEAQARADVWRYNCGTVETKVARCVVELGIPDILEKHGSPMSLSDLSSAVACPTSFIYRIMRFLTHNGIFKKNHVGSSIHYSQSPLSRLFMRDKMAPFILLNGVSEGPVQGLCAEAIRTGKRPDLDVSAGEVEWTADFLNHGDIFTQAMECHARVTTSAIINSYPKVFQGVGSLVDVGGRHGLALGMLVEAFPHIRCICFDLPKVVSHAPPRVGIEFVGGNMFESVPKADAVMLMRVCHDWSDEACIDILKKCKEAVPGNTGKVMIVDAVIYEEGEDEYDGARLALDMMMMAVTVQGKERTYKEWVHLMDAAGFSKHKVTNIKAIESVIEAYP